MKKRVLIVYNPNSGLGVPVMTLNKFYNELKSRDYEADLRITEGPNDATNIVSSSEDYDYVFSVGGDGTLNEVVTGNLKRDNKMVVCPFPTGSCNDVAKMLGYKNKKLFENLDLAFNGSVCDIDIASINNKPFVYVTGMGKFLNISYETVREKKSNIGYLAYIRDGIKEFFKDTELYNMKVNVDGKNLDGKYSIAIISNSTHIAGIPNFYKDAKLDDNQLEILLCKTNTKSGLIKNAVDFLMKGEADDIISIKGKNISISLDKVPEKSFCIDGEKLDCNDKDYYIRTNNKVKFLVPKKNVNKLFLKEI